MKICSMIGFALLLASSGLRAEEKHERASWNQEKAEEIVKAVIAQENRGDFAWDKIAWHTDAKKVAKIAQKEGAPIFVYLYLKKDVGPKAAPC